MKWILAFSLLTMGCTTYDASFGYSVGTCFKRRSDELEKDTSVYKIVEAGKYNFIVKQDKSPKYNYVYSKDDIIAISYIVDCPAGL